MATNQNEFNKKADKLNCRYWWIMQLDLNHTRNTRNEIIGYGKFQGDDECLDKHQQLMSRIEMLYKYKYMERANAIEIFAKKPGQLPTNTDEHILTLYKHDYEIPPDVQRKYTPELREWLSKFYDAIKGGKDITHLRPRNRVKLVPRNKDNIFNVRTYFFKTYHELEQWGVHKVQSGHNRYEVEEFIKRYCYEKPFNTIAA